MVVCGQDSARVKISPQWISNWEDQHTFEALPRTGESKLISTVETPGPVEQSRYGDADAVLIGMRAILRNKVAESKGAHVGTPSDKHYNCQ